ncbi:MAG: bifunctional NAD(P)H-hydrate repair enzyme [Rhodomicrobium sp.]|nr:MAG: bifunctional NAD(P)H-hydrate repair enzyme [Rhodomicrobium sp.]
MKLLLTQEMSEADSRTINSGISGVFLMRRAGEQVANVVEELGRGPHTVISFAGPGNNGGDAIIAALLLGQRGYHVKLLMLTECRTLKGDARHMAELYKASGLPLHENISNWPASELANHLDPGATLIDGLLGAGLDRPLQPPLSNIVIEMNKHNGPIIAVDVPTGVNGNSGCAMAQNNTVIKATKTVTFFRPKPGHYLMPGRELCGELQVRDIGIPKRVLDQIAPKTELNSPGIWQKAANAAARKVQRSSAHKYDNGACLVIGGDDTMLGAATLSSNAALRGGAGLVTVAINRPDHPPAKLFSTVMTTKRPGADGVNEIIQNRKISAALIGPGCLPDEETRALVTSLMSLDIALVLDAGALSAFKDQSGEFIKALKQRSNQQTILTPHEGEFKKLSKGGSDHKENREGVSLGQNDEKMPEGKLAAAQRAATETGAVVILKGTDTVIAAPDGRAAINNNAPATLATAGTGDVLAGMVLAALARGYKAYEAAARAVYLHGAVAAHIGHTLVADDIIDSIPIVEADLAI